MFKFLKRTNLALDSSITRMRTGPSSSGFTIVEIIAVVFIIIILSLIVVSLYDNIAVQAHDSSLKSDLSTAADQLKLDSLKGGLYPATAAEVNNGAGFDLSEGNTITYMRKPYGYCMYGSNPDATTTYMVRSLDGVIKEGDCDMEISLFAGSGTTTGYVDSVVPTNARFNMSLDRGITISSKGDIYVSDYNNYLVRKISSVGAVTTHVGSGASTCATGTQFTAQLGYIGGMQYDSRTDTLYFMACTSARMYKMTSDGTVSLVAGGGATSTCNTASGAVTSFNNVRDITLGGDGRMYIAGTGMHKICKVNVTTGATTLVAGSSAGNTEGTGSAAQFNNPSSIVMDSAGNLFVTDQSNNRIRKVTQAGVMTTFAGSGVAGNADGVGTAATFNGPRGMAIDRYDTLYLMSVASVRIITSDGTVTTLRTSSGSANLPWPGGSFAGSLEFDSKGILYGMTVRGIVKIIV